MTTININEAKTHLSRYARMVKSGETIILCDRNIPFAEIRPIQKGVHHSKKRPLGRLKGKVEFNEASFWEADAEITEDFNDGIIFPEGPSK